MIKLIASILVAISLILPPRCVGAEKSVPLWKQKRIALKECYIQNEFRVFYALAGAGALSPAQSEDTDKDGVPDKIQNIARQLVVASRLYVEVFKLRHPLESPRYKGQVKFIDVHVSLLPMEPGGGKNGSAGDGIVNYQRPSDPPGGYDVLTIDLSKDIPCDNLSPAHELFHEFQNGYSLFKNSWYTEGTARWSESALRKGVGKAGAIPTTDVERKALYTASYDASAYWNALAVACDKAGTFSVPKDLAEIVYVGTQQRIIEDLRLHGAAFIKALLEELAVADHRVSQAEGLNPLDWKEARQRAPDNNDIIWDATQTVLRRFTSFTKDK
jgi:hypothetical protein